MIPLVLLQLRQMSNIVPNTGYFEYSDSVSSIRTNRITVLL